MPDVVLWHIVDAISLVSVIVIVKKRPDLVVAILDFFAQFFF